MGTAPGPLRPWSLFFDSILEGTFFDFGWILEGFWEPNMVPKSISGLFFSRFSSSMVLASILNQFLKARNLKNSNFVSTGARFLQNRRFRKSIEKILVLESLSGAKTMKNREKKVLKTMCFLDIDFSSLFFDFSRFWLDFGRPRRLKKSIKNRKNRVQDGFGTRLGSSIDFGHDFGAILVDFGWILDGFWEDFGKIFGRI